MSEKEVKSCLLCGVGGQGTVLASRIIAAAAMAKGLRAKTAETIGMAQRGGSVVSHVRIGEAIASPTIPLGTADVMIGFEPGEAAANIKYLKEDGILIVSSKQVKPEEPKRVDAEACIGCMQCINEIGCPGLITKNAKATIDTSLCTGCGLCTQICPVNAIG